MTRKKKPVPEEKQLKLLKEQLTGHAIFRKWRGQGSKGSVGPILEVISKIVEITDSPTKFLARFQEVFSDFKVLGNLLAKFKRDSHDLAAESFLEMLANPDYFLQGETIPVEQTTAVTLVMFNAHSAFDYINYLLHGNCQNFLEYLVASTSLTKYEASKIIEKYKYVQRDPYEIYSQNPERLVLYSLYRNAVSLCLEKMQSLNENKKVEILKIFAFMEEQLYNGVGNLGPIKAFLVFGDQKQFLKNFPRELQETIGTWQFFLPADLVKRIKDGDFYDNMFLGFHDEREHEDLKKQSPVYCSKGVNRKKGAIIYKIGKTEFIKNYRTYYDHSKFHGQDRWVWKSRWGIDFS